MRWARHDPVGTGDDGLAACGEEADFVQRARVARATAKPVAASGQMMMEGLPGRALKSINRCQLRNIRRRTYFSACGISGCTSRNCTPGNVPRGCICEPIHAIGPEGGKQHSHRGGGAPAPAGKFRQRGPQKNRQERQAVSAHQAGGLEKSQRRAPAIGRKVPGEPGEEMAAQPFRPSHSRWRRPKAGRSPPARKKRRGRRPARHKAPDPPSGRPGQTASARDDWWDRPGRHSRSSASR